jgi:DNA uptake protein ComE-like DNA-binding protein
MARSRFGISSKGADDRREGTGSEERAEELAPPTAAAPAPEPPRPGAEEWRLEGPPRASTDAGSHRKDAEELLPAELARPKAASPTPVPEAAEWLPAGDEADGEVTSIAAMAAAAEELAEGSDGAPASERELEPPSWVTAERRAASEPEPASERQSEPEPEPERRPEPKPEAAPEPETAPEPEPTLESKPNASEPADEANGRLSLSAAELDELRELGMSVTQAKRVLRYRAQRGGFADLDELDRVPGFPREFLAEIRERVVP